MIAIRTGELYMELGEMKIWQLCDLSFEQGHAESKKGPRDRKEKQTGMGGPRVEMRREEILALKLGRNLGMELGLGKMGLIGKWVFGKQYGF